MFFARVEEGVADTLPAIFRQQHAFAEIEQACGIVPQRLERAAKFGLLAVHRGSGGRPDNAVPVHCRHEDRAFFGCEFPKVFAFVGSIAIVEIRPLRKHRDPQFGQRIERRCQFRAAKGSYPDRHVSGAIGAGASPQLLSRARFCMRQANAPDQADAPDSAAGATVF